MTIGGTSQPDPHDPRMVWVNKVLDETYSKLLAYARRGLFSKTASKVSASDIVQMAMKSFVSDVKNSRISVPPEAWEALMFAYVRNKLRQAIRLAYQRRKEQSMDSRDLDQLPNPKSAPTDKEAQLAKEEVAEEIEKKLPKDDRTASVFREVICNGHTQEEAARILGVTERTVRNKLEVITHHLVDLLLADAHLAPEIEEAIRLVLDPRTREKADPPVSGENLTQFERRIKAAARKVGVETREMEQRVQQGLQRLGELFS